MLALVVSTIAFFVAAFFIKRRLEEMDIPAGLTRNALVFSLSLALSYIVALVVDKLAGG
jgi:hypothetical protein